MTTPDDDDDISTEISLNIHASMTFGMGHTLMIANEELPPDAAKRVAMSVAKEMVGLISAAVFGLPGRMYPDAVARYMILSWVGHVASAHPGHCDHEGDPDHKHAPHLAFGLVDADGEVTPRTAEEVQQGTLGNALLAVGQLVAARVADDDEMMAALLDSYLGPPLVFTPDEAATMPADAAREHSKEVIYRMLRFLQAAASVFRTTLEYGDKVYSVLADDQSDRWPVGDPTDPRGDSPGDYTPRGD